MFVYPSSVSCMYVLLVIRARTGDRNRIVWRGTIYLQCSERKALQRKKICVPLYITAPKPPTRASAIQGSRAARDHARHNAKLCTQTHDTHNTAARSHAQAPPHLEIVLSHAHTTAHLVPSTSALLFLFPAHAHGTPTRATRVSACAGPVPVATPRIALPCEDESKVSKGYESAMRR